MGCYDFYSNPLTGLTDDFLQGNDALKSLTMRRDYNIRSEIKMQFGLCVGICKVGNFKYAGMSRYG